MSRTRPEEAHSSIFHCSANRACQGDNHGSWEFIRMQIPTVIGAAMSAQAYTSGTVYRVTAKAKLRQRQFHARF